MQAAEEKNVSQALIQDKAETLPDIKKEVHIWEKKYQVNEKITTPCVGQFTYKCIKYLYIVLYLVPSEP